MTLPISSRAFIAIFPTACTLTARRVRKSRRSPLRLARAAAPVLRLPSRLLQSCGRGPENLGCGGSRICPHQQKEIEDLEVVVGPDDAGTRSLTIDGSHVYWAQQAEGVIGRTDLDLQDPEYDFINPRVRPSASPPPGSACSRLLQQGKSLPIRAGTSTATTPAAAPSPISPRTPPPPTAPKCRACWAPRPTVLTSTSPPMPT